MTSQYVHLETNSYIIRMSREDHLCWFHGKISRERAEEILKNEGKSDGVFLVRECSVTAGDFVLSLVHDGMVCHYQIRRYGEDAFYAIGNNEKFHGLDALIEHYQESSNGLPTQLSAIVKCDPPPNHSRSHGQTNLLHRATVNNNQTVVSELLKCGYRNSDAKNKDGQTAIHLACIHSDEQILKLLLNAGTNVNCWDTAGNTPLHYACQKKSGSFVQALIDAKANIQNRNINTACVPLHEAAKFGNLEAIKVLLAAKAPLWPRSSLGELPVDLAKEAGHTEVVTFLETYIQPPAKSFKSQWCHGTLDRYEAANILLKFAENLNKKKDENGNRENATETSENHSKTEENGNVSTKPIDSGLFLIRYSKGTEFVLTMLDNNVPKHFKIQTFNNKFYIDEGPYWPTLEHLVEHYTFMSDGLPTNLRYPVPPKPKPPLPFISTIPRNTAKKHPMKDTHTHSMPKRNHSIPGDNAMNNVGLFETELSPNKSQLSSDSSFDAKSPPSSTKKFKDIRDNSIFNSLRMKPKRNIITDGMRSTRSKKELKKERKTSENSESTKVDEVIQTLIKNLSFSTDFLKQPSTKVVPSSSDNDTLYNVPKNNCAINASVDNNQTSIELSEKRIELLNHELAKDISEPEENKTEVELEYFTTSDLVIARSTEVKNDNYFVDAPPRVNMNTFPINSPSSTSLQSNPSGYVPTVDVHYFVNAPSTRNETDIRELPKHSARIDSMISTASGDSEFSRFFDRSLSTASTASTNVDSQLKLNYFIPSEFLELDETIGIGEFGSVYKGSLFRAKGENNEEIRIHVAIKTLRNDRCRQNKQEFLREASVMIRLQHHCIVKLIGISKGKTLMMVQELVPLGSMLDFIQDNPKKVNPNYELKIWASQIACGMHYLESQHFVHRDLAARNILLASRNQAKISDFGLSRALGSDNDCYQASQSGKWPIKWYAPESYNHGLFSHASDVWSFGVTLWEMFSKGEPPYGDKRWADVFTLVEEGYRLPQPVLCPDNVYQIMKNCWSYKARDRPTFRYLQEIFLNDPDYQNLIELIPTEHIN